nr:MAG TPA: hypothetical protein [Caudoviricetes sp.]
MAVYKRRGIGADRPCPGSSAGGPVRTPRFRLSERDHPACVVQDCWRRDQDLPG